MVRKHIANNINDNIKAYYSQMKTQKIVLVTVSYWKRTWYMILISKT